MERKKPNLFVEKLKGLIPFSGKKNRARQNAEQDSARNAPQLSRKSIRRLRTARKRNDNDGLPQNESQHLKSRIRTAELRKDFLTLQTRTLAENKSRSIVMSKKSPKMIKVRRNENEFPLNEKQKETFLKFITEIYDIGIAGLVQQFTDEIFTHRPRNDQYEAFKKNLKRNRYQGVKCLDKTRVILKQKQDYIHANYVTSKYLLNQFICTQGPMRTTVNDFWIMIMQENVRYIIMLCNMIENGKKKCFAYYPTEAGEKFEFDEITISNLNVDTHDRFTIISQLKVEKNDNELLLSHIFWKDWPDHGVPTSVLAPFSVLRMVHQSENRPIVVHCSAGIGRTGTIMAIEMGLAQLLHCVPLNLVELCKELRNMRAYSVQTNIQFVYIAKCLLAYAWCSGILMDIPTLISKADLFDKKYKELLESQNVKDEEETRTREVEQTVYAGDNLSVTCNEDMSAISTLKQNILKNKQ